MNFYVDIESIPDQRPDALEAAQDRVKVPGNISKPETATRYREEHGEKAWLETALDGAYGEIICCCWTIDDEPVKTYARTNELNEGIILELINDVLAEQNEHLLHFVGFNVGWDLEFLWKRFVIHKIRPAVHIPYRAAPWQGKYTDLMYQWAGAERNKWPKQKQLCKILGIDIPDNDIDGSEVWTAVKEGRMDDVVKHCQADVERVREIYRRLS